MFWWNDKIKFLTARWKQSIQKWVYGHIHFETRSFVSKMKTYIPHLSHVFKLAASRTRAEVYTNQNLCLEFKMVARDSSQLEKFHKPVSKLYQIQNILFWVCRVLLMYAHWFDKILLRIFHISTYIVHILSLEVRNAQ